MSEATKPRVWQSRKSFVLKLLLTIGLLSGVAIFADQNDFWRLSGRFAWGQLVYLPLAYVLVVLLLSYRWHLCLGEPGFFRSSVVSTVLGLGANQVLPARGGDWLRAILAVKQGAVSTHEAFSALVLEKLVELLVIAIIGLLAIIALMSGYAYGQQHTRAVSIAIAVSAIAAMIIGLATRGLLAPATKQAFRALHLGPRWYVHVYRALSALSKASRGRRLVVLVAVTAVMWLVVYAWLYSLIAAAANIELSYVEILMLLFVGALALALPAAPSGVGTFHASIVSGFLLLGRPATEGLVFAVVVHGILFVSYVLPAMFLQVLAWWRKI
jgi:uncharacterized protein (TIRG00374 family)